MHVVPDVAFEIPGRAETLDLWRLARIETDAPAIIAELDDFVDNYLSWIEGIKATVSSQVDPRLPERPTGLSAAWRLPNTGCAAASACWLTISRVRQAFGMANLAMLMQMVHSAPDLAGTPHRPSQAPHTSGPSIRGRGISGARSSSGSCC